ncbi:Hypothetical predicted protein, partial [Mytilus galloprovincialis]
SPCHVGPCQNDGTCSVSGSTYSCACTLGYYGTDCESKACKQNTCQNGGTCNPTGGSNYECSCPLGWYGSTCSE